MVLAAEKKLHSFILKFSIIINLPICIYNLMKIINFCYLMFFKRKKLGVSIENNFSCLIWSFSKTWTKFLGTPPQVKCLIVNKKVCRLMGGAGSRYLLWKRILLTSILGDAGTIEAICVISNIIRAFLKRTIIEIEGV